MENTNKSENTQLYCLANNYMSKGFKAVAVWNHKPTFDEIMKVGLFKQNPTRKLEIDLANHIINKGLCRLNFLNYQENYESWIEYSLFKVEENGDLNLSDFMITGICDMYGDEYNLYEKDYVSK